jgi:hypothetical protein
MMHAVAVNYYLNDEGVIFEGCQWRHDSSTKAFYLTENTGRLLLDRPTEVFVYYVRPSVAVNIKTIIPRPQNKKRKRNGVADFSSNKKRNE